MLDRLLISSSARAIDPQFRNVTLLLHGDGSNGAQNNTFLDSSSNNFTITRNGNTTQGSFSPYGTRWSNYFNGSSYHTSPSSTAFAFGTGDYTIECWVYPISTQGNMRLWEFSDNADNADINIGSTGSLNYYNGSVVHTSSSGLIPANAWTHIAIVRSSGTVRGYVNGTQALSQSSTPNTTSARTISVAGYVDDYLFEGYIADFRVVKGTAVYTANFTPPITPLTAISGTSLLTCQSNRFRDASTNNFAITRNGDVRVTPFSPYAPTAPYSAAANGGSAYFDGGLDYLTTPSSAALNLQSTWTIEFWYYPIAASDQYPTPISVGNGYSNVICIFDRFNNSAAGSVFTVRVNGTANQWNGTATVNNGAWHHVAMVCDSNALRVYVNGVLDISATISPVSSNRPVWIGTNHDNASYNTDINGYMAGVRIVNNAAVYTANFTPPTSPPSAIANTQLLCNFTNAAIVDSAADNDLETVGNAQVSTVQSKFGGSSVYFDGSGDYLTRPNSDINNLGTGDFTIELWFKSNTGTMNTHACLVASYSSATYGAWAFKAQSGSSGYIEFASYGNSWNDWVTTTNIAADQQWHHCAVTRNGNTLRIFVDGVVVGTWTNLGSVQPFSGGGHPLTVGYMAQDATSYLNGYIDDLRITKGVARYTANFTPPAAPFSDQ